MATKPSLLIPNVRDPQHEAAWKSIKAVTDYQFTQMAGFASATALAALSAQIAALQAQVAALSVSTATTYTANQTIAKGQVVYEPLPGMVALADSGTQTQAQSILGIATAAGTSGTQITVATAGQTVTGLFGLTPGPVFLGPSGSLTSTPPAAPSFVGYVGYAISSTSVLVLTQSPQQVFENQTPTITYPAIAFAPSGYTNLYLLKVNA